MSHFEALPLPAAALPAAGLLAAEASLDDSLEAAMARLFLARCFLIMLAI